MGSYLEIVQIEIPEPFRSMKVIVQNRTHIARIFLLNQRTVCFQRAHSENVKPYMWFQSSARGRLIKFTSDEDLPQTEDEVAYVLLPSVEGLPDTIFIRKEELARTIRLLTESQMYRTLHFAQHPEDRKYF